MKKQIIQVLALSLCVLFAGCKNDKEYKPLNKNQALSEKYKNITDFNQLLLLSNNIVFSENNNNFVGEIRRVILEANKIYVADATTTKSVFCYDENGRFRNKVGKYGLGPSEYTSSTLIASNEKYLIIYDQGQKKILLYTANNDYSTEIKLKYNYAAISMCSDGVFLLRYEYGNNMKLNNVIIDVYDFNMSFARNIKLPITEMNNKYINLAELNLGFIVTTKYIYYASPADFKIRCLNKTTGEIVWISSPPRMVNTEDVPADQSFESIAKWFKSHSKFFGFHVMDNGLIIMHTDYNFLLYDDNGNYLTYVKALPGMYYDNGKSLYRLIDATKNENNELNSNKLEKYDFN